MPETISNGELGRRIDALTTMMSNGFTGVNLRLDRVNGQLDKHRDQIAVHTTTLAEHALKIDGLQFEPEPEKPQENKDQDQTPVTLRDLKVAGFAVVGLTQLIEWLPKILQMVKQQ